MSNSPTTGEIYYSGDWVDVKNVLRVLNIGEGKMDRVTQSLVENYQQAVDREIDGILSEIYSVPLRAFNEVQPDGSTKRVFPGDVTQLAKYWTAGLLLLNEFQQLAQNVTDQATQYVEESRRKIFCLKRFTHRLRGQERKSNWSRTLPPSMQPPAIVEKDY